MRSWKLKTVSLYLCSRRCLRGKKQDTKTSVIVNEENKDLVGGGNLGALHTGAWNLVEILFVRRCMAENIKTTCPKIVLHLKIF